MGHIEGGAMQDWYGEEGEGRGEGEYQKKNSVFLK